MAISLIDTPKLSDCKIDFRDYQTEAVDAVRDEFRKGRRRTLIVMATGTGKTPTFGLAVRRVIENGGRALVLAHTGELIEQAVAKLDLLGIECGTEKANQHARSMYEPDCVVASVQTMRGKRLETWSRDYFRLIVIDEAHHAISDSYTRILKHFRTAYVLGVTATADRADEEDLGQVFESVAYEFSLWDAMTAPEPGPYLCRLRVVQCDVGIDLRDLNPKGEDFTDSDLEARIGPMVETLANAIRQEAGDRQTIIFTPRIKSSMAMASALQSMGIAAEWTCGDDPDRARKIADYHDGSVRMLANASVLTEGFDAPNTAAIALCRPTKSRALYSQMVGRATRLAPGKPDAILIDFNFLTSKHQLVRPVELFDTYRTDTETLAIADEMTRKDRQLDLVTAIEQAREVQKERQVLRIAARERQVKYRRISYDPLAVYDAIGLPWRGRKPGEASIVKATAAQVQALKRFKVEGAESMPMSKASRLLGILIERSRQHLATHKQVAHLIANGIEPEQARTMTLKEASAALDEIFGKKKTG